MTFASAASASLTIGLDPPSHSLRLTPDLRRSRKGAITWCF